MLTCYTLPDNKYCVASVSDQKCNFTVIDDARIAIAYHTSERTHKR